MLKWYWTEAGKAETLVFSSSGFQDNFLKKEKKENEKNYELVVTKALKRI